MRQMKKVQKDFASYTSPILPGSYHRARKTLHDGSKPIQILKNCSSIEEIKDQLPHSAGYLIVQLTDDEQYILVGFMIINKERKVKYFLLKLALSQENRSILFQMVKTLAQNKQTMQKAPITIEEDLINLERDSNEEITKLIE